MAKYLKKFNSIEDYLNYIINNPEVVKPNVSIVLKNPGVAYFNPLLKLNYLTFVALEDGRFSFGYDGDEENNRMYYSLDKGSTWTKLASNEVIPIVKAGEKIMWKCNAIDTGEGSEYGEFGSTGRFDAEGNIMSILFGDNFVNKTDFGKYKMRIFAYLFSDRENYIVNAKNLILPATTLTDGCYSSMFSGRDILISAPELPATTLAEECYMSMFSSCTSLTTPPKLPATTLAYGCYSSMFKDCTKLSTIPELPATTLADSCYAYMFNGCTSLVTSTELPATTLANNCYESMFAGCTKLRYIKCLATNISAPYCLNYWVENVYSTGTFVKDSSTTWSRGTSGIPNGWTIQNA